MNKAKTNEPVIVTLDKPITVVGLKMRIGMKSVFRDVTKILKQYMAKIEVYAWIYYNENEEIHI